MGLSINPFNPSASVPANTTTDQARTTTDAIIQNQNALRLKGVEKATVVVAPNGQIVFNA
jgi:hypothetical protein